MSLRATLIEAIDRAVNTYIDTIANDYNLNRNELQKLWNETTNTQTVTKVQKPKVQVVEVEVKEDVEYDQLMKAKKPELVAMCKTRGLKCSGNKSVLIERLLGKEPTTTKKSAAPKKKTKAAVKQAPVIKRLLSTTVSEIVLRENNFGNIVHVPTSFVFDDRKQVIGVQNDDGSIDELDEENIEQCKKYKFDYVLPDNLDLHTNLDDVEVEELDDDSELDEDDKS